MTRKEEIIGAGIEYTMCTRPNVLSGDKFFEEMRKFNRNKAFEEGAKWADKTIIDKACEWLMKNIITTEVKDIKSIIGEVNYYTKENRKVLINNFREAMEE